MKSLMQRRLLSSAVLSPAQLPAQIVIPHGLACLVGDNGRGLFATKDFGEGDVLFEEAAAITFSPTSSFDDQDALRETFLAKTPQERELMRSVLHIPNRGVVQQQVRQNLHPLLINVLHSWSNCDTWKDTREHSAREWIDLKWMLKANAFSDGLYLMGSLINHTCGEATVLPVESEFIAAKDIRAGEELLINYSPLMFMDQRSRRDLLLAHMGFVCRCDRCVNSHDASGVLPCPKCDSGARGADGLLLEGRGDRGVVIPRNFSQTKYRCHSCKEVFAEEGFGLLDEAILPQAADYALPACSTVHELMENARVVAIVEAWMLHCNDYTDSAPLLHNLPAERVFGPKHWAAHTKDLRAVQAWIDAPADAIARVTGLQGMRSLLLWILVLSEFADNIGDTYKTHHNPDVLAMLEDVVAILPDVKGAPGDIELSQEVHQLFHMYPDL